MTMHEESLFAKPVADWTDEELRVGAVQAALRRNELAAAGEAEQAEFLNDLCVDVVEERDRRVALRREVEDAMVTVGPATVEAEPQDPERERRLQVATAEWRARRAKLARTKPVCPKGHFCGARVWHTSTGLLFTASGPPPHRRSGDPRRVPFATLLDGAGGYNLECTRCEGRSCHFDLGKVRRAALAGARLHFAT